MNIVPSAMSRQVFRQVLVLKKNSPNLMFGVGIAGVVTSTVMACRATLKLSEQLPEMQQEMSEIKDIAHASDDDKKKDIAFVYGKNIGKAAQLYAPAIVVGVAGIGLLTGSHVALNRRNAGLTAAYAVLDKSMREYRDRVKKELGDERERDIYRSTTVEKHDTEDGKNQEVRIANPDGLSAYARFFDEYSTEWKKNAEYNRMFVTCQEQYANELLKSRGHLFLNEVYDMLGLDRTTAGSVVGWILCDDSDGFVDFGLHEVYNSRFLAGNERSVLLDFNVDGVIYDKLG